VAPPILVFVLPTGLPYCSRSHQHFLFHILFQAIVHWRTALRFGQLVFKLHLFGLIHYHSRRLAGNSFSSHPKTPSEEVNAKGIRSGADPTQTSWRLLQTTLGCVFLPAVKTLQPPLQRQPTGAVRSIGVWPWAALAHAPVTMERRKCEMQRRSDALMRERGKMGEVPVRRNLCTAAPFLSQDA
jgi:hypothetical protein